MIKSESERVRKSRVPIGCSRKFNKEGDVIKNYLNDFDIKNSRGAAYIKNLTGTNIEQISQYNINCLGLIFSHHINVAFSRNHQRSKKLAIKWFDENFETLELHNFVINPL